MVVLEQYAYHSRMRGESPAAKAVFSLGSLLIVVSAASVALSAAVFCIMSGCCICKAGVRIRHYLLLCAVPLGFVTVGALTVAVQFSSSAEGIFSLPLPGYYLVMTAQGAAQGIRLLLQSMAGVSCVYFLYLSTTVNALLGLLERLHTPKLFTELMLLIYRFIFVLIELCKQIDLAQKARLGNIGLCSSLRSMGLLGASVLFGAFKRSNEILTAMESRGYDGTLAYTAPVIFATGRQRALLCGYLLLLAAAAVVCSYIGI